MGPPELPGGNARRPPSRCPRSAKLQWGRRNYPAETPDDAANTVTLALASMGPPELPGGNGADVGNQRSTHDCASMGPPELPGGNTTVSPLAMFVTFLLQWGRRNYPAETLKEAAADLQTAEKLQWGRRNYPAETPADGQPWGRPAGASMGPPELPGGNCLQGTTSTP